MEFIRPKRASMSLDMTPMIDIVFQLLIFFMLSSSFLTPSLKLTLPKAVHTESKEQEEIVVSLDKTGQVFLNTQKISMQELKSELEKRLTASGKKAIHLRGDENMPFKLFVEAMDLSRQAGASQINIVYENQQS